MITPGAVKVLEGSSGGVKCPTAHKMNDESNESVHLSPCVYVKDEPVHGNTLNDER